MELKEVRAVVQKIILDGDHGPYVVATSESIAGSVTFSLEPTVWQEDEYPELGMVVVLTKLRKKRNGWRAKEGRFLNPSDEQKERSNKMDLNKIVGNFGVYVGGNRYGEIRKICERINSSHGLPIINRRHLGDGWGQDKSDKNIAELIDSGSHFEFKQARYVLVKLVEEWDMEHEKATYLLRLSVGETHVGIVGMVMDELREKNLGLVPTLRQSAHHEPAIIAEAEEGAKAHHAAVEGSGFVVVDVKEKTVTVYGRSASFFVQYKRQVDEFLGMTGHEFVAKILEAHLPEDWKFIVVNNDSQPILSDSGLGENYPIPPGK